MTVVDMSERVLHVRLLEGDHDGQLALISRITLVRTPTPNFALKFKRRQFPVRVAFATTINKAPKDNQLHT